MTWPLYFPFAESLAEESTAPPAWRPILRHNQRTRHPSKAGGPKAYGVAVDVWRGGQHLWRSYAVETGSTCDAWTDENLGASAPRNHDGGLWGVPGVVDVADYPIPSKASLAPVHGLQGVADLLYTMSAIASRPEWDTAPAPLTMPPSEPSIRQRLSHAERGYCVIAYTEQGVSLRAMVAPLEGACVTAVPRVPLKRLKATLVRRETRAGVIDMSNGTITAGLSVTLDVPADAPDHIVARRAKSALGVQGWQAARVPYGSPGLAIWHIARTPYKMVIESVDDSRTPGIGCKPEDNAND